MAYQTGDFYIEQLVKKDYKGREGLYKMLWMATGMLVLAGGFFIGALPVMIIGIIILVGGYIVLIPRLAIEYEYLYVNKELSVDVIYNRDSRRNLFSLDLTNMDTAAPEGSDYLTECSRRKWQGRAIDVSSGREEADRYVIYINDKGYSRITIEPNEELKAALAGQFPRQWHSR